MTSIRRVFFVAVQTGLRSISSPERVKERDALPTTSTLQHATPTHLAGEEVVLERGR